MPNLAEILRSVRLDARAGRSKLPATGWQMPDWSWVLPEFTTMRETYDRIGRLNPRPPGWHNAIVQLGKRAFARGLDWHVRQQRVFNYAVMTTSMALHWACQTYERMLTELRSEMDLVGHSQEEHRSRVAAALNLAETRITTAWRQEAAGLRQQLAEATVTAETIEKLKWESEQDRTYLWEKVRGEVDSLREDIRQMREQLSAELGQLREALHKDVQSLQAELKAAQGSLGAEQPLTEEKFDFYRFEPSFRGDPQSVRQRQALYLPYFQQNGPVVDLGCGRGEFVQMLIANGIEATGVDINASMVAHARSRGVPAVQADMFDYLHRLPDASLGGIFCAQVIEHLTPNSVLDLLRLARRKLRLSGVAVFETQNPQCLYSIAGYFWLDPSHRHPIHYSQLTCLADMAGFRKTEVLWLNECPPENRLPRFPGGRSSDREDFDAAIDRFNQHFLGPADYAVVAWKATQDFLSVNSATLSEGPVAPGSLISGFSARLAEKTLEAKDFPLPRELGGVQVRVGGEAAPLLYVSPEQINFVVPQGAAPGTTTAELIVDGKVSSRGQLEVAPAAPGLFTRDGSGSGPGQVTNADGSPNSPETPAARGTQIQLLGTGAGPVVPPVADGDPAPADPLSRTAVMPEVYIGGLAAEVKFSGLVPGRVGNWRIDVVVPPEVEPGDEVVVWVRASGRDSNRITIAVR